MSDHPPLLTHSYRPVAQRQATKRLAVLALVFSLLPIVVVSQVAALVLAIIHLSRRATRDIARGMAISAIVLSVVMSLVYLDITFLIVDATGAKPARSAQARIVDPGTLTVGQCGLDPSGARTYLNDVTVLPCSQPHTFEVYAIFDLSGNNPGDERLGRMADDGCHARFAAYVGTAFENSSLDYSELIPSAADWSFDRGVQCLLITHHEVRGSLKGSKQ